MGGEKSIEILATERAPQHHKMSDSSSSDDERKKERSKRFENKKFKIDLIVAIFQLNQIVLDEDL